MSSSAKAVISELIEQLCGLKKATRLECFIWWAAARGTVLSLLRDAPKEFRGEWDRRWRDNEPDAVALELSQGFSGPR